MRTVTVRELKSNPSEALRDARDGPVLVLNRGLPEALIVTVAGEASRIGVADRVGEAVEILHGLADRGETRAVRAVDRAASAPRGRGVSERHASYGGHSAHALATLTATLEAIASPRRIWIGGRLQRGRTSRRHHRPGPGAGAEPGPSHRGSCRHRGGTDRNSYRS